LLSARNMRILSIKHKFSVTVMTNFPYGDKFVSFVTMKKIQIEHNSIFLYYRAQNLHTSRGDKNFQLLIVAYVYPTRRKKFRKDTGQNLNKFRQLKSVFSQIPSCGFVVCSII
jgi:hypothetical protein